jgi:hypothetical protein
MNEILDILTEADRKDVDDATRAELERVRSRGILPPRLSTAKLMPEHLRPPGLPNPLDTLHELSSEGLNAAPRKSVENDSSPLAEFSGELAGPKIKCSRRCG